MLESLHIRNLAVVAELDVEFSSGLNVVTGETGAGKSLILGALQLLLGERASPTVIRRDAQHCEISARIQPPARNRELVRELTAFLDGAGIAGDDDGLILRRVITPSGSRNFINATPVTLQVLRQLGELLIDIHGPHDHQSLLQPRTQLDLLDSYAGLESDLAACREAHAAAAAARAAQESLQAEHLSPQEEDFLRFQLTEIERANLQENEDTELAARHAVAAHRRSLLEVTGACRRGLTEADGCVTEQLGSLLRLMSEVERVDAERGAAFVQRLEEAITGLQDLSGDLESYAGSLDLDEAELAQLEERLGVIQKLKRKYGPGLADIEKTATSCRERLAAMASRQDRLHALTLDVKKLDATHQAVCRALSAARRTAAVKLAAAITGKLQRLGFANGTFEVRLQDAAPGPRGADQAEFCFAPNPGENLLPLRQIASSGEIARVMLAVKTILSQADRVPILIFDEVDANVGGRVAVKVAAELKAISERHQVLCISHLPQIAAVAAHHFRVSKTVTKEGRTLTAMDRLDDAQREEEITRMLGADADSAAAREHAREMLAAPARGH